MIYLLIFFIFIIIFLLICLGVAIKKYNKIFGYHFYVSPLIKSYTIDDFNISETKETIVIGKDEISTYLYSDKDIKSDKIIIFSHGMYSDHTSYLQEIGYLVNNGFLVLAYDALGYGASGTSLIKGFGNNTKSLDIVIKNVKAKYPQSKIYLIGHSLGAYATLSVLKYHNDVEKICVLSPFVSYYKELKNMTQTRFLSIFVYIIDLFKNGKYACINTKKILTKYNGEVLVISSKDDSIISFNNTKYLMDNFKNFNYIIEETKDHNPDYTNEAVKKLKEFRNNLSILKGEELINYMNHIDFKKLGELDSKVTYKIVVFLNK